MRRIRLYHPHHLTTGLTVMLEKNASHHLLQVLRKKTGDTLFVFNEKDGEYDATIQSEQKKIACIEIGKYHERKTESPLRIHLGQGISRSDRMDYAIQKATELGVAEITPLFSEFCQVQLSAERMEKRIAHWQAITVSAAEQSGRCAVPVVHPVMPFSEWITQNEKIKFICCPRPTEQNMLSEKIKNCLLTIGPEGGFSQAEIENALQQNFSILSLGPRILRTETATVVAMTVLQSWCGDL
ncbi:MAG: hypothetical protein ACD_42C00198G0002 [uncultured bacterium]|nr:MAG: hypothetical protein ACD_42C00198G0002 [uncultured bacterium]OGT25561.1 MAG: 16S rRNA (uracil(1498)-N(3))-methyltransferase [Gammaproteobacteria bacterium RIFCSPHIGHO2_02_FULL_42_43]OGT28900.1 MAG: 16S rRNA (uracil(1498)-N(3))-methyltransferase [Gammaproteobacteria bacterium RIFCSPHIGHO2_01_FULL_42_8]OGT51515.1 MAG: 16S rRNA (uracil(1498)-N(3))-methyltransferase [Gammaproteobacteria bacterium RIFCSPHIGHO2_12_FULL_41_25]OGT62216.1 MAG: 16S rRNA (uracil(1498)-N(3))-methyltransferase [Gamm